MPKSTTGPKEAICRFVSDLNNSGVASEENKLSPSSRPRVGFLMVGASRFSVRFREVVVAAVVYGEDDDVWIDLKKDGSFLETLFAITEVFL